IRILLLVVLSSFFYLTILQAQSTYEKSGVGDNWFIHLGVGGQIYFGDNDNKADFKDRISVMPAVSVGKWLNPTWGLQLKAQGGALHGYENDGNFRQRDKYYNIHLNALWDLTNQIGGYSSSRIFQISPYIGLGFAHRFGMDEDVLVPVSAGVQSNYRDYANALSVNGGIKMGFKLSERVSLDIDLGASVVPDYFDRIVQGSEYEAILSATGGITYRFGKIGFNSIEPMDPTTIGKLNERINTLRDANERLSLQLAERPESCPECPPVAPEIPVMTEISYIPNVVFFKMNSFNVDDDQQLSVYNTAEFVKENGAKVKVTGYADKDTGSQSFNLKLSEKRAKAVAHELISKYKVPSQNVIVEWKGTEEQPYNVNNWNRVVVMTPQK
ncbi:MAG: OmpA family protein, partial [Bacteroidales bacterium]|nr:OmpA family protein [Bacteroidales bacterium]